MPSVKKEREFDANRQRYQDAKKSMKTAFIISAAVPAAGVVILGVYYFIRALAGMASGSLLVGELIVKEYLGGDTPAAENLMYEYPYAFMGFLLLTAGFTVAGYCTRKRGYNIALLVFYALGGITGIVGLIGGDTGIVMGLYLIVCGALGVWVERYILGIYKEIDYLSLQEGFPDFIIAMHEPHTMANTITLNRKNNEYRKLQQKEIKEGKEQAENGTAAPPSFEMEELTVDTELPKGSRKIDSML